MQPLPYANEVDRKFFVDWLTTFAAFVRDVDYRSARPLFHAEIIAFGTHRDVITSVDQWVTIQWDHVWSKTADFAFDLEQTKALIADDASMASVIAPWTSTGFDENQSVFERPGRATLVFHNHNQQWICVHSHMSLNRGVPQQSYADRPVKN